MPDHSKHWSDGNPCGSKNNFPLQASAEMLARGCAASSIRAAYSVVGLYRLGTIGAKRKKVGLYADGCERDASTSDTENEPYHHKRPPTHTLQLFAQADKIQACGSKCGKVLTTLSVLQREILNNGEGVTSSVDKIRVLLHISEVRHSSLRYRASLTRRSPY